VKVLLDKEHDTVAIPLARLLLTQFPLHVSSSRPFEIFSLDLILKPNPSFTISLNNEAPFTTRAERCKFEPRKKKRFT
jgi:hypothetical protein